MPSNSGEDDFYDATPGFNSSHSGKKRLRHIVKYATVSYIYNGLLFLDAFYCESVPKYFFPIFSFTKG